MTIKNLHCGYENSQNMEKFSGIRNYNSCYQKLAEEDTNVEHTLDYPNLGLIQTHILGVRRK